MIHSFHIPVLGLGFSIDTPLKVARYGISSVVSVVDDELIERMRQHHSEKNKLPFTPIKKTEEDYRAKRITAYLNLLNSLVELQITELKKREFTPESDITRYFDLLPDDSTLKQSYNEMLLETDGEKKKELQDNLRSILQKGAIEVNIMSKVDKMNLGKDGLSLGEKFSDALASLRGFAESDLTSSLILSAGMSPRLYSYLAEFDCFNPKVSSPLKKKVVLKVSDFRSALIQAKFLAKKGLWVHEFRIESGLNCGGHAFATEGYLLGPILQEFKDKRSEMTTELYEIYKNFFKTSVDIDVDQPVTRITVQGGIGTSEENIFLQRYYNLDGTGWGSPFLLVPEATNVDKDTLNLLKDAIVNDFYISGASPLGIPFNNFRKSTAEIQRLERIAKGRPGSPCNKKFLVSNTEFTEEAICTASRQYQNLKIKQLQNTELSAEQYDVKFKQITEKLCLCEGLCSSAYIKNNMLKARENPAVAICPGPNTAYFSGIYSLDEMVKHIYGKINLLKNVNRPNIFINELKLYVDYLRKDIENSAQEMTDKKLKQLERFKDQLLNGIEYYNQLYPNIQKFCESCSKTFQYELKTLGSQIQKLEIGIT
ncbi:hypothetical protein WG906_02115 [Pedobacter sp. P351]|uniref:hypothetical protein n=1 Tax=Pedobacter superstes TaxID=3133441 RepID=UPI0030B4DD58